jgi:Tautomerase enzyme
LFDAAGRRTACTTSSQNRALTPIAWCPAHQSRSSAGRRSLQGITDSFIARIWVSPERPLLSQPATRESCIEPIRHTLDAFIADPQKAIPGNVMQFPGVADEKRRAEIIDYLKTVKCIRFLHGPSFLGLKYSDDFIVLEIAFISGRPKETRLALLRELNSRIVAGAGISPDDLMIQLVEGPGENFSFGRGLAQRAFISQAA